MKVAMMLLLVVVVAALGVAVRLALPSGLLQS